MERPDSRLSVFLAIFLLGIAAQVVQAWLVRETLVVFYGNEVSLGAFFGSWLFWIALGSLAVIRLRDTPWVQDARRGLGGIMLLLPPVLVLQVMAVRGVRLALDTPSVELVPLGELFASVALLTAPGALALGLAFPLACKALGESESGAMVRGISRLYVVEAAGALLGGVLFTFVLAHWLGVWRGLGGLTLALALIGWRLKPGPGRGAVAAALGLLGLLLALPPIAERVGVRMETLRFSSLQPGLELLDAVETRYGHVAYARFGGQISVVRNGRVAESFPQPEDVRQTAAYVYAQAPGAARLLLFDGFAGGLAAELLRYPVRHIDLVLQDRHAFDRLLPLLSPENRAALDDPRLQLHFVDGRRYLRDLKEPAYDLVLALDAAPTSAHSNRYFTREFYAGVKRRMAADGVLCTQVSSASNYLGGAVRSYSGSVYRTLAEVFAEVAVQPGDEHLYCAGSRPGRVSEDPSELRRRYLATELDEHRFPDLSFYSLMPLERIRELHRQFREQPGELNTDNRPVTFYLNVLLWGRYSASALADGLQRLRSLDIWPYLVPVTVFLCLWLVRGILESRPPLRARRQSGAFALALLGLVAMALQLVVLFHYQAHVGFMFERVALLNALFMTGLALGTGLLGQWLAQRGRAEPRLMALVLLVAGIVLGTPAALDRVAVLSGWDQEGAYFGISFLFGLLTGAGFPLGVRLAQADLGGAAPTGGLSEAADSLGGALGGLLTGALLVPLLGVSGTCNLLAVLSLAVLFPLAWARWVPGPWPALAARGSRAFTWSTVGWLLTFTVLVLYGWQLVQRGFEPGPQTRFDDSLLARVSGSEQFEAADTAFPLYLGRDAGRPAAMAPDSASLSSMTVAADVRGYAGPINLLLAVDRDGRLRGVHYLDSNETPSYIADIDTWLSGLAGFDLAEAGLDLERVDALSGATVTSRAALDAINRAAAAAGQGAFSKSFATPKAQPTVWGALGEPRFLLTLGLLLVAIPVYLSGSERARLGLLAASLALLGFWLNSLVTEVDLVNLGLGRWASLSENPQRWLLLGFVGVSALLFGQIWCGCLCPFGALQELLSRLGRRLGLRRYPQRPLETRLRFLKFLLLGLMLAAVLLHDEPFWASFNPMQHAFGGRYQGWVWLVLALSLVGALFYVRFWCRYFCPFGAFLALSNKIALLQRFAPRRRFEHCDLGVREEFDLDCIRCNRCVSGCDTHAHKHAHKQVQAPTRIGT
jgi:predicted membrane-bound spermidine synthase/Na+-translocating ferredoxin:NAD+ oxidoreductase RnfG subunit